MDTKTQINNLNARENNTKILRQSLVRRVRIDMKNPTSGVNAAFVG